MINLKLVIDSKPLLGIFKNPFFNYELKELRISKIGLTLSDNFTSHKKPELPVVIKPGQTQKLEFLIKPHFQMEQSFI